MGIAYLVITILLAAIVTFSGIGKIRHDPRIVQVIHELIGVPLKYFPLLAACEFAGALGVVLGIWWPLLGVAAGIGLVIYFVGASVSHLRVGDVTMLSDLASGDWSPNRMKPRRMTWSNQVPSLSGH